MGEQQKSLEKFIKKNVDFSNILKKMDKLMDNANLWHLRDQIFEDLSHEDVLNCRRVCKYWNESLRRMSDVKFIQEFGERVVEYRNEKVSTLIPGWKKAAQKYGVQASMDDLGKSKTYLKKLARGKGKCISDPVHEAARNGYVKLMEFILRTSFDMNTKDDFGRTAWHFACSNDQTETAQVIIKNSKYFSIDLNAKDYNGYTAWHLACKYDKTETAQIIIKNSKDFAIDLNTKNNRGGTALHWACFYGNTETVQLIIKNSKEFDIDLNGKSNWGGTALHWACRDGQTETAQLIIQNSKEFGIDLNAKDNSGCTALHDAFYNGETETVQMILKNWKEFGIDIKAQDNHGETALDIINHRRGEKANQMKKMLEKEYSQIDVTEPVQKKFKR